MIRQAGMTFVSISVSGLGTANRCFRKYHCAKTLKHETNEITVTYAYKRVMGIACFTTETKTALFEV